MDKVIAVTGEGPTDYGSADYDKKKGKRWRWGPVYSLLNRCAIYQGRTLEAGFVPVQKDEVKRVKLQKLLSRSGDKLWYFLC